MCDCGSEWQYVIAICGGLFALVQWGRSLRISRSQFVQNMLKTLSGEDVQDVLMSQDSCEDDWLESRIGVSDAAGDFEAKLKKALSSFDILSHLYFIGNISESDLRVFLPDALRLIKDGQVRKYIQDQENEYLERTEIDELPYLHFVMLGKIYGIDDGKFSKYQFGTIGKTLLFLRRLVSKTFGVISRRASIVRYDKERIGVLVMGRFKAAIIARAGKDEATLLKLQDRTYSKETFGLTYALLIKSESVVPNLNRRYYVEDLQINGHTYRMCNNWYERQRDRIESWINHG